MFQADISGILGAESCFEGKVEFEGCFRIDGNFKGSVRSKGNNDIVIISQNSCFEGEIIADYVILSGAFYGSIKAISEFHVTKTGVFEGLVYTTNLIVDIGGLFQGECMNIQDFSDHDKKVFKLTEFTQVYENLLSP